VLLQIRLGEFGILQLNANGAVIGRARRSDEDDRAWSSARQCPSDHVDANRRSDANMATVRRIASIGEHGDTASNDTASRGYFGLKPERIMTSTRRPRSDAPRHEQRQHRSMSDLTSPLDHQSRDRHRDAATWRQPEAVYADDGASVRRRKTQFGGIVASSVELKTRQQHGGGATRDAGDTGRESDAPRHRRVATDCHKEQLHHRKQTGRHGVGEHITTSANVDHDVDHATAVDVQQTGPTVPKTEVTLVDELGVDERRKVKTQSVVEASRRRTPSADHRFGSSHAENAVARRVAMYKSGAAVVATSSQIWWPCQESNDEEESNDDDDDDSSCDDDRGADTDDDANAADADADDDDTAKATSWTQMDASVEESIRELDDFLLEQDSDPL